MGRLACPFCDGKVGGPFRQGRRWKLTVRHLPHCPTRRNPVYRGRVSRYVIAAAFPVRSDDEVEIAHRVLGPASTGAPRARRSQPG
jgi:hypothetical protein